MTNMHKIDIRIKIQRNARGQLKEHETESETTIERENKESSKEWQRNC